MYFSEMIFDATEQAGVRALVSAGWVRDICALSSSYVPLYPSGRIGWHVYSITHIHPGKCSA